jgi:hypothetical protein
MNQFFVNDQDVRAVLKSSQFNKKSLLVSFDILDEDGYVNKNVNY